VGQRTTIRYCSRADVAVDQCRQQVSTFVVAQKFHGHVNFANGLHLRILGQRRLHLRWQEQELDLHDLQDMGSVYRG
jgi:hypothetical protein